MAQDGHQGPGGCNGHSATPLETVTNTPASPCESNNQGTWIPVPALAAEVGNGKDVVVPSVFDGEERGSATGGSRTGADLSKGKGLAVAIAMATDVTEGDVTKGKGKGKAAARGARNLKMERERRKRTTKMYDELRTILPNVNSKTNKTVIVTKTIGFIRHLEDTVQKLEKQKQELAFARQVATAHLESGTSSAAPPEAAQVTTLSPVLPQGWGWLPKKKQEQPAAVAAAPPRIGFQTWSKKNIVLNVCGDEAYILLCAPRHSGVLTMVLSVMEKHHIDVFSMQITGNDDRTVFNISTRVNVEEIRQLDPEAPESKYIYQLAVSEIMVWLSSS